MNVQLIFLIKFQKSKKLRSTIVAELLRLRDFYQMVMVSTPLSKLIIAILVLMSIYTWAIIIYKWRYFRKIFKENNQTLRAFSGHGEKIIDAPLPQKDNHITKLIKAVREEITTRQTRDAQGHTITQRFLPSPQAMRDKLDAEIEVILAESERLVVFLSTSANVGPLMGLLGTVLGITVSFWEIGKMSTANIAVVAPGMAEALITTIVGLIVAVPAALGHSWCMSKLDDLATQLDVFTKNILAQLYKKAGGAQ